MKTTYTIYTMGYIVLVVFIVPLYISILMEQFRFRNWQVYKDSQKLFSDVSTIVSTLPYQYKTSLGDQITRSSLSIVLNIAEGSGKNSIKEMNRFLDVALGSAYETLACIDTLTLTKYITQEQQNGLETQITSICSQIGGFKKKLKNNLQQVR